MKSQDDITKTLLHDIFDQLGPLASNTCRLMQDWAPSNPQTQTPLVMTTSTSAGWKKPALKPSSPADFDGDWTKGKAFLTSCWTYIWLCADSFEDDATKIVWAMSPIKTRWASQWAHQELELEASQELLQFVDWLDFEDEFWKDFTPLNTEALAVNTLETTSYFQGHWSVNDYLDQFWDLIYDSGYTNPKTIVVKFWQELDWCITSAIGGMATRRPPTLTLKGGLNLQSNWIRTKQPTKPSRPLTDQVQPPLHILTHDLDSSPCLSQHWHYPQANLHIVTWPLVT